MAVHSPPLWLQAGSYSATEDRQLVRALRYNQGVIDSTMLKVTQSTTASMILNVASGYALIDGTTSSSLQGTYLLYNDATTTVTVSAADASLPRIDLVIARVQDAAFAGSVNSATIEMVTGTPASSPVAPALPANSLRLATINVAAATTAISSANITDGRTVAKFRNNIIAASSQASRDSLPTTSGLAVIRTDTNALEVYTGTTWVTLTQAVPTTDSGWITMSALGTGWVAYTGGGTYNSPPQYRQVGNTVELRGLLVRASSGGVSSGLGTLPTAYCPVATHGFIQRFKDSWGWYTVAPTGALGFSYGGKALTDLVSGDIACVDTRWFLG